jgi:hypothetical protein
MTRKANKRLEEIDKKQVFIVPDNYFESLPGQIQQKIQSHAHRRPAFSFSWLKYGVSLATVCLFIWAGYIYYHSSDTNQLQTENILAEVSTDAIITYLQQNEVSQFELVERVSQANIELNNGLLYESEVNNEILLEEADTFLIEDFI